MGKKAENLPVAATIAGELILATEQAGTELSPIEKAESVGKVVATQLNYSLIVYETTDAVVQELADQYGKLKGDTSEGYDAVVKAIADCRNRRTTVDKMKAVYKRPALDWNTEAEKRAKDIIAKLQAIEDPLKAEKDRIDAVKAEEKRAREEARLRNLKNQQDNLSKVRLLSTNLYGLNMEQLQAELKALDEFDLEKIDLGEYLEDAKVELANARIRVESAIAAEKQRLEVEAEKERLRKQREEQEAKEREAEEKRKAEEAERKRKEAEAEKARQEEAAAKQRELDAAKARLAELEAKQAPAPVEPVAQELPHAEATSEPQRTVQHQSDPVQRDNSSGGFGYYSTGSRPAPAAQTVHENADKARLEKFITQLAAVSFGAPTLENTEAQEALARVVTTIDKAVAFLNDTRNKVF